MRVVLIGPVYPYRGGIAHHTALLSNSLRASGHDVLVISFKRQYPRWLYPGSTDLDPSQVPLQVDAEYLLDPLYPWTWQAARRRIVAFSPHLVLIQWWTTFWALAFSNISSACQRMHLPVAYILHNVLPHEPHPWDAWLAPLALQHGDTIIAQNPNEAHRLLELLPAAHVETCEMPIYSGLAVQLIPRQQARQKLGIGSERPLLLFFGIIRPYKGLHVLLDALAILKSGEPSPMLIVAGEFWEGEQDYINAIQQLGLQDAVRLENRYIPNEELGLYFSAADALVAPYLAGTQSASVALALGLGLPVILTERIAAGVPPDYRSLVSIVPAGDAALLSQAIRNLLADPPRSQPPILDPQSDWLRFVHLVETLSQAGSLA